MLSTILQVYRVYARLIWSKDYHAISAIHMLEYSDIIYNKV